MSKTTPNRLQTDWESVQRFVKTEWPLLTDFDLKEIDGEYDRLVLKIKELYHGPAWITQEAGIKDKLQNFLNSLSS
ncbi:MAG: hypothetical protein HYS22_06600 [Deltaproteobacteria bacterium]|nr:hypothetical protein [Deltaproteobacteria bacterium]